jgi:hypothetical protein
MKTKGHVFNRFQEFKALVENPQNNGVVELHFLNYTFVLVQHFLNYIDQTLV